MIPKGKISRIDRVIFSSIAFFTIFCAVFSGDFSVSGLYVFFLSPIIIILFRSALRISARKAEITSFLGMALVFSVVMLVNSADLSSYYWALVFAILFLFSIPLIELLLEQSEVAYICGLILLAMLPFALLAIAQGHVRSSLLFGPNVYYRVVGFIYLMFLLTSILTGAATKYRFFFLTVAIIILFSTGSRGTLPVTAALIIFYIKSTLKKSQYNTLKLITGATLLISGVLYNLESIRARFWRLFYFDLENASLHTRFLFLLDAKHYVETMSFKDFLFGDGESQRVFSFYPHNIILETFVYHGVFMVLIFLTFGTFLLYTFFQPIDGKNKNANLVIIFSPIFLGSMVSGSFFEAYSIAAVATFAFSRTVLKKTSEVHSPSSIVSRV